MFAAVFLHQVALGKDWSKNLKLAFNYLNVPISKFVGPFSEQRSGNLENEISLATDRWQYHS